MNELEPVQLFVPIYQFGKWTVWSLQHEEIVRTVRPMHQPKLNGMYLLLDGQVAPCYFGASADICRRLRNHTQSWNRAICVTLGSADLCQGHRDHIEFTAGLVLLLTGTATRNSRLDYAEPDPVAAQLAQSFLHDALIPLLSHHGRELGLPTGKTKTVIGQVFKLLERSAQNGNGAVRDSLPRL